MEAEIVYWILMVVVIPVVSFFIGFIYKAKTTGNKELGWEDLEDLLTDDEFWDMIKKIREAWEKKKAEDDALPK